MKNHPYAEIIWNRLMNEFNNAYGVAGLMGNLRAESGLYPDRMEGDVPYSSVSKMYTQDVDSGEMRRGAFVNDAVGYGLAQWTFSSRKSALYDYWKAGGYSSIGSVELGCDFLIHELKTSYTSVYNAIKNATNIRTPSDVVLHDFENPADQSESVEVVRETLGREVYNAFAGGQVTPDTPKKKKGMKLLLMYIATRK